MDRNIYVVGGRGTGKTSLSARRAWIEMRPGLACSAICTVALRKESVDRNSCCSCRAHNVSQSLSARRAWIEITTYLDTSSIDDVALRKESVDRNFDIGNPTSTLPRSLSARRAWIEIMMCLQLALLLKSLSARRAWIEMLMAAALRVKLRVALRKESVDRNFLELSPWGAGGGRSPQGERG